MTDKKLTAAQIVPVAGATLQTLKNLSTNPDAKPAPEGHERVAFAADKAYKNWKDPLCKEGYEAGDKASQNLLNQFSNAAAIQDPYIQARQKHALGTEKQELEESLKRLNDHCLPSTTSGISSPKL